MAGIFFGIKVSTRKKRVLTIRRKAGKRNEIKTVRRQSYFKVSGSGMSCEGKNIQIQVRTGSKGPLAPTS